MYLFADMMMINSIIDMQVTTFSKREQVTQAVLTLVMAKVGVPLKHSLEFMFQVFTFIIIDVVPFYPLNFSLKGCISAFKISPLESPLN